MKSRNVKCEKGGVEYRTAGINNSSWSEALGMNNSSWSEALSRVDSHYEETMNEKCEKN